MSEPELEEAGWNYLVLKLRVIKNKGMDARHYCWMSSKIEEHLGLLEAEHIQRDLQRFPG